MGGMGGRGKGPRGKGRVVEGVGEKGRALCQQQSLTLLLSPLRCVDVCVFVCAARVCVGVCGVVSRDGLLSSNCLTMRVWVVAQTSRYAGVRWVVHRCPPSSVIVPLFIKPSFESSEPEV
jgi:hypothetical protein